MADERPSMTLRDAAGSFHSRLRDVEGHLRRGLEILDELGLSHAGAHVDLALHQLRRDSGELRAFAREADSSEPGSMG